MIIFEFHLQTITPFFLNSIHYHFDLSKLYQIISIQIIIFLERFSLLNPNIPPTIFLNEKLNVISEIPFFSFSVLVLVLYHRVILFPAQRTVWLRFLYHFKARRTNTHMSTRHQNALALAAQTH